MEGFLTTSVETESAEVSSTDGLLGILDSLTKTCWLPTAVRPTARRVFMMSLGKCSQKSSLGPGGDFCEVRPVSPRPSLHGVRHQWHSAGATNLSALFRHEKTSTAYCRCH
ncbi:unnamed protein product [Durusdinium trenchii]|uniref:Uncharacterized protein n=1 Tax=Durusdinium trenchii TaxID=1381693 RepID=A0ABP0IU39_9DINO